MDYNLPQTIGKHVFGDSGITITNFRHSPLTLEAPTNSVINTLKRSSKKYAGKPDEPLQKYESSRAVITQFAMTSIKCRKEKVQKHRITIKAP